MKCRLKSREVTSLLVNLIAVKMLFTYPRYIVERCQNGAWISVAVFSAAAVLIYFITQIVYFKTGRTSILSQAEAIGGKWFRMITGVVIILILMINIAPIVRAFPEAIKTALLQNTIMIEITFILSVAVVFGAYSGIAALGRISSIFLPIAGVFLLAFFITLTPFYKVNNLFPLAVKQNLTQGASALSIFSDIIVINLLLPYIDDMKTVKKSGFTAIIIAAIASFVIVLAYCLVYPYPSSTTFIVPMYQLARVVKIGTYFQRLEAVFEFVWSIAIFLYLSVYLFILCDVFRRSFGLKHYKPFIIPMLAILTRIVFWEQSYTAALEDNFYITVLLYPIIYTIPLVYGLIYMLKRHKTEEELKG